MSWNGSGTYTPPAASFPEVNGTLVDATRFNNTINDIAAGITNCLAKDGQNVPTANLSMGGFKHTSVANASASGQYLAWGQTAPFGDGTVSLPSITFASDLDTGTYRVAANSMGLAAGGVLGLTVNSTNLLAGLPLNFAAAGRLGYLAETDVATIAGVSTANYGITAGANYTSMGGQGLGLSGYYGILFATGGAERARFNQSGEFGLNQQPASGIKMAVTASGSDRPFQLSIANEDGTHPVLLTRNTSAASAVQLAVYHLGTTLQLGNYRVGGSLQLVAGAAVGLTLNSVGAATLVGAMTAAGFVGPLTGNASTATAMAWAAAYFNATSSATSAAGTTEAATYSVEDFDVGANFNVTTGRFTAPATGVYHFVFAVQANTAAGSRVTGFLRINGAGTNYGIATAEGNAAGGSNRGTGSITLALTSGQYVSVWTTVSGGAATLVEQFNGARIA